MTSFPNLVVVVLAEAECVNAVQKGEEDPIHAQELEYQISRDGKAVPCVLLSNDAVHPQQNVFS